MNELSTFDWQIDQPKKKYEFSCILDVEKNELLVSSSEQEMSN